jgi:hypothetical protein
MAALHCVSDAADLLAEDILPALRRLEHNHATRQEELELMKSEIYSLKRTMKSSLDMSRDIGPAMSDKILPEFGLTVVTRTQVSTAC